MDMCEKSDAFDSIYNLVLPEIEEILVAEFEEKVANNELIAADAIWECMRNLGIDAGLPERITTT